MFKTLKYTFVCVYARVYAHMHMCAHMQKNWKGSEGLACLSSG